MKLHNPLQKTNLEETEMPFKQVPFIKGSSKSIINFEKTLHLFKKYIFSNIKIIQNRVSGVFLFSPPGDLLRKPKSEHFGWGKRWK